VLGHGVVVTAKQTRKTPIVALNFAMRAGSICDPPEAPGTVNLLSRVIDRGTLTRSAEAIAEELDNCGISLTFTVNRHQVSAACTCLAPDFERVFTLVADILQCPSFPEAELAKRRGEVVTAIRQDDDNTGVRAAEGLMALLYGDRHPYGRRQKGTIDVVERLTRDDLAALHTARFAPSELSIVIVGDVQPDLVVDLAERVYGSWNTPKPSAVPVPPPSPAPGRRRAVLSMMNKAQADIAYGFVAIGRNDPRYYAYWLMNNALGQYALGGRLGDNIRERQGMAYYVSSILDANVVEGPLMIRAGVSPSNVDRAIAAIDHELVRLRTDGLMPKELAESRQYLIGAMPRALETNAGIANFLQNAELFGLGPDYDVQLPSLLSAVTLDEANDAARRTLDPERATIVVAGPYEDRGIE
jgi:zinc protease